MENDAQRQSLMGRIGFLNNANEAIGKPWVKKVEFYSKQDNSLYEVTETDNTGVTSYALKTANSVGTAYGDNLHISNAVGQRYISTIYEKFIERL